MSKFIDPSFRLGAIPTDIRCEDFEASLALMRADGLLEADIESVFGKRPGTHTDAEHEKIRTLLAQYGVRARVIAGMTFRNESLWDIDVGTPKYEQMLTELRRQMELAKLLDCRIVRTLFFSKQACIWGHSGAEQRNGYHNKSWDKMRRLFDAPLALAEAHGVTLAIETGVNIALTSGWLLRSFVESMGSPALGIIWDPANMLINREYPDETFAEIDRHIVHVHIKDGRYDPVRASITSTAVGQGDLREYLPSIRRNLEQIGYQGVISLENFYVPEGKTTLEGYLESVPAFKEAFGNGGMEP